MTERRTRIVATVGPASAGERELALLAKAGVDVFRLNFSHGTRRSHAEAVEHIRRVREGLGRPIALMQDLQGPRIRTGRLAGGGPIDLPAGARLVIAAGDFEGDAKRIATTYVDLARDVKAGDTILLSDGLIELLVEDVKGPEIVCRVVDGDQLGEHKGMNLPGVELSIHSPTDKDLEDLAFGVELGVDAVALSFVRSADDVRRLKAELARLGAPDVPVIAKIERPEAVERVESILECADGVMVARGDLGIEMPPETVPAAQKHIIAAANRAGAPVITATQMLDSMVHNRRPTRAEASDVANAILDGTDAVMLSAETAVGSHPVEATYRRLALVWGVHPVLFPVFDSTDEMIERGEARLLELGLAHVGDTMVCVAGASTNTAGGTDMLKIHYFDGKSPYA
jgi:pyruvate kinase